MNEDISKIIRYLKYLNITGLRPDIEYNDRLFLQKVVYILKVLGIKFSYEFTLYLKGPYSHLLTCDYFQHSDTISSITYPGDSVNIPYKDPLDLDSVDREILDSVREIILLNPKYQEKKYELLECIATILYLIKEFHMQEESKIKQELKMIKPYLSSPVITTGLNCVKELLFKPEFLTDEIKQEINLWDKAED